MFNRQSTAAALVCFATRVTLTHSMTTSAKVNLLDLASAAVACTVTASRSILKLAQPNGDDEDAKNTRLKSDGSFVTDADFAAQGVIVQAIRTVSTDVRIVGEESEEEMASHIGLHDVLDDDIMKRTKQELRLRYHRGKDVEHLPLAPKGSSLAPAVEEADPESCIVDASRVSIIIDPLDGTKSYAHGDYDSVSILIGIILDNTPCFGVIGKPFGYTGLEPILDTGCVTFYGGPLIKGVYIAGGEPVIPTPIDADAADEDLPRAVISSSRSKGVVNDFCLHLGEKKIVYPEPMLISGAGEKSLRLILQRHNEALWFFPKGGTSLWDVAAPDALLRSLGGRMTDKYGNDMDYSKPRDEAENIDGVVACIDEKLHAKCISLFKEGDWSDRK